MNTETGGKEMKLQKYIDEVIEEMYKHFQKVGYYNREDFLVERLAKAYKKIEHMWNLAFLILGIIMGIFLANGIFNSGK